MVIENDPSARMQVRSRGQLVAPACCCVCGNATSDEGYLDLGAFVDFHGTLYLCMACVTQGAETCGMFTPAEVSHLQNQIASLLTEKQALSEELTKANEYISNFDNLLRTALTSPDGSSNSPDPSVPDATPGPESREPEVTEPNPFSNSEPVGGAKLRNITFD